MILSPRDMQILRLVGRFGQMTTSQLRTCCFASNRSPTASERVLKRLVDTKCLRRFETRTVGGWKGGSGQYVYQLGSKGWTALRREGKYWPYRAVDMHRLAVAATYVQAVQASHDGLLEVDGYTCEPDTWQTIGGAEIRPDLALELKLDTHRLYLWLEVDMGTERPKQVTEKLTRYWHAYKHWNTEHAGQPFPLVVFVAVDEERKRELEKLTTQSANAAKLFRVVLPEELKNLWISPAF